MAFPLLHLSVAIANVALGTFVFLRGPRRRANQLIAGIAMISAFWALLTAFYSFVDDPTILAQVRVPLVLWIFAFALHLSLVFPAPLLYPSRSEWVARYPMLRFWPKSFLAIGEWMVKRPRGLSATCYLLAFLLTVYYISLIPSSVYIRGFVETAWGREVLLGVLSPWFYPAIPYLSFMAFTVGTHFIAALIKAKTRSVRRAIRLVFAGLLLYFLLAAVNDFVLESWLGILVPPLAGVSSLALIFCTTVAIVRHRAFVLPAEKVVQRGGPLMPPGCYLVFERRPSRALGLFADGLRGGLPGVALSRTPPTWLRSLLGNGGAATIWLCSKPLPDQNMHCARNLAEAAELAGEFFRQAPEGILLFEGFEYLLSRIGFAKTMGLVHELVELSLARGGRLVVSINPDVLSVRERALLEQDFEVIDSGEMR